MQMSPLQRVVEFLAGTCRSPRHAGFEIQRPRRESTCGGNPWQHTKQASPQATKSDGMGHE